MLKHLCCAGLVWAGLSTIAFAQESMFDGKLPDTDIAAVQLYTQDELLRLINLNTHLQRVKLDRCQLVQDIQARAEVLQVPSYQFLWGDMLAWGVCVERDPSRGIMQMQAAAAQGLPAALEHLGRYHHLAILVTQDTPLAIRYLYEAAALGSRKALLRLADLLIAGHGSPHDFEDVYVWLYHTITADQSLRSQVNQKMQQLASKMSNSSVNRARLVMQR